MTADDSEALTEILLHVARNVDASVGRLDEFGQRYIIDFTLATAERSVVARAAWIVRPTEDFPRLTSCFIVRE